MKKINLEIVIDDKLCHDDCPYYIKGNIEDNCDLFCKEIEDKKRCQLCLWACEG